MVITVDMYKQIRKMYLDGVSLRKIAATLHISRNTVQKYCCGNNVPWERKPYSRKAPVLTQEVNDFIRKCIAEDARSPSRKQRHTARRIYDRLVAECGFTGAESTVRSQVRVLRDTAREAFIPLSFPPGDSMQIDWGEAAVYIAGAKTKVYLFCARLCASGAPFVRAYRRQNEESFLDALIQTFQFFGGVPRNVVFDNARVAVREGFGAHAQKQEKYAALAAHYGFEAVFCNPASGNEKGLVEGLVGYIRRNVCVPIPKVQAVDELNQMLEEKCRQYQSHTIRGREGTVGDNLQQEKVFLAPLPGYPFDPCKRVTGLVSRFCTVRFETNAYSVPAAYCGREVTVKAGPEKISVFYEGTCIARHQRCLARNQTIYELAHYLPLLKKKGRAILYARPVQETLPQDFLEWLKSQPFSQKDLTDILEQYCRDEGHTMKAALSPPPIPIHDLVDVKPSDLQAYDVFLSRKAGSADERYR